MQGFQLAAVDGIDAAGLQGCGSGVHIGDGQHFHGLKVGPVGPPVVGITPGQRADAGLELDQLIAAGSHTGRDIAVVGLNGQVDIGQHERKIGLPVPEFKDYPGLAVGTEVEDIVQQNLDRRDRFPSPVMVDRGNHVRSLQGFAVMKFDTPPQAKAPHPGVRRHVPAVGQLRAGPALLVELHQGIAELTERQQGHEGVRDAGRVKRVAGKAARDPQPQQPALLRAVEPRLGQQAGGGRSQPQARGQELPTGQRAGDG